MLVETRLEVLELQELFSGESELPDYLYESNCSFWIIDGKTDKERLLRWECQKRRNLRSGCRTKIPTTGTERPQAVS
jgi:hypothetical protein